MTISAELKSALILEVRKFYATLDAWHDETHGERVVQNALRLAASENLDPDLVELAAWVHQYHDNLTELRNVLDRVAIDAPLANTLYRVAAVCRPHKIGASCSLLEQVIFDADAMELLGAYGVVREVLCNRECRKMPLKQSLAAAREVQELFRAKLQTQMARQVAHSSSAIEDNFWSDLYKNL